METKPKRGEAITQRYKTEKKTLELLQRLLSKAETPARKRKEVMNYCRCNSESERVVWRKLSLFREAGPTGVIFEKPAVKVFDYLVNNLRERILVLIKELCPEHLSDFGQLVVFTERLLERIEYLCDLLLYVFLEKEKGETGEPVETTRYTDWIIRKMFLEADAIKRLSDLYPPEKLNDEYASWLEDGIIDEGVVACESL